MSEARTSTPLWILCFIAIAGVLYILKPLLIPFLIAVMISYLLSPLIERLAMARIPRIVSLLLIYLLGIGVLGYMVGSLAENATGFANNLPAYQEQLGVLLAQYSATDPWIQSTLNDVTGFLFSLPLGSYANSLVNFSLNFLSDLLLVILFVTYLCLSIPTYPGKITRAFDAPKAKRIQNIVNHINQGIRQYLGIHTLVSLAVGVTVTVICWSFDLPFAPLWGFLAFALNYIPTLGSLVALLPVVVTGLVQLGLSATVIMVALILLSQLFWENVVESKLMGESLGISPVIILLSLGFWGWLWGIVGAILAIPIASMIKIICENVPDLKSFAVLMDDKE